VCVGITSFNVPLLLFAAKVAPALAMGNTIIVKPSERNCFSTMYLGKLFKEAGFPPGVLNIVIGAGNTGSLLVTHPDVNKVILPPCNSSPDYPAHMEILSFEICPNHFTGLLHRQRRYRY
jgi:delta 1-pyrroline-5-carboxylate dehydrogenase